MAAPAVWGRAEMSIFLRSSLWIAMRLSPGMALSGGPVRVVASDNHAALRRLSTDPLTIHETRVDTLRGLGDLMDGALASARNFTGPALFLDGGQEGRGPGHAPPAPRAAE